MLGDEVHDALTAQIQLAVLLAAAEHGLALEGLDAKLIRPAGLAREVDRDAVLQLVHRCGQRVALRGECDRVAAEALLRERDALALDHRGLYGAAVGAIFLLAPHGSHKGLPSARKQHVAVLLHLKCHVLHLLDCMFTSSLSLADARQLPQGGSLRVRGSLSEGAVSRKAD